MRASTGQHWIALDHVRALAAFMVFTWHFIHASNGYPVPIDGAPALFPLALLDEGHTGVSLFMALSGYLFAKLLDGKAVDYPLFFWNRFVRLAPMLIVAVLVADFFRALEGRDGAVLPSLARLAYGFVDPAEPLANGLWSIVVETHFYLVLPLLLLACRYTRWAPLLCLAAALALRTGLSLSVGDARFLAYSTIVGHIDQFLLGIFAFQQRGLVRGRHTLAALSALGFTLFYYAFDRSGGWYHLDDRGVNGLVWVVLPTIEGAAYALLIAWYDASFTPRKTGISGFVAQAGAYSYSIYLLHFFVVFKVAQIIDERVMDLSNFYVACLWSAVCFCLAVPFARLCFRCIEEPFLKLRRPYLRAAPTPEPHRPLLSRSTAGR